MEKGQDSPLSKWQKARVEGVSVRRLLLEFGLFTVLYYSYVLTKNLLHEDPSFFAFLHASFIINLEIDLGIFKEAAFQLWLLANAKWVVVLFNWVYFLGFMPTLVSTALLSYIFRRDLYYKYRNIMLISFVFTLLIFLVFPLAPPRYLPLFGFVDTIREMGPFSHTSGSTVMVSNQFAAMPSMHYGWALMVALLWAEAGNAWMKVTAFIYQGVVFIAVIITANHYFLDPVAGTGIILISILTYRWVSRRKTTLKPLLGNPHFRAPAGIVR